MGMVLLGLSVVYFIAWYWLLFRLVKTKELYPIVGRGWKTRVFWGFTFVFFNPLLSLLFFIFGVRLKTSENQPKHLTAIRVICLPLVAFTLILFEIPMGVPHAQPKQWTKATPRPGYSEMTILGNSAAKVSAGGSTGWHGYHYFDPSRVAIITHGKHPFMTHLGHTVAAHFNTIPAVQSVTFHPNGKRFEEAALMPSLIIELREKSVSGLPLPAGLMLDADIEVSIKSSQYTSSRWSQLPLALISANSSVKEKFTSFGVASPSAKYDRIAKKILNDVGLSFGGFIFAWWQFEPLPPIPDYMYGKGGRAPEHIIPESVAELHLNGGHLLIHDIALWEFPEGEKLTRLQTRFEQEGWATEKNRNDYLRMVREQEQLIFKTENGPLEARYINTFSSGEVDQALERLLADPTIEVDTLLFFGARFRTSTRKDLFQAYHARLETVAPESFHMALERSLVHEHAGEVEKAKTMLAVARAYERVLTSPQGGWDVDTLAKRIGVDTADETTIDMSVTESHSVNNAMERGEDIVQKTPANKVFRFHFIGSENNPTRYFTARMTDLMWPMTPTAGGINRNEPLKALTVTGQAFGFGTSHSFNVCAKKGNLLARQNMSININLPHVTIEVAETENGELEWRLTSPPATTY